MSAATTKTNGSSEGSGMRAASSICAPGPAPTEILIGQADELMACIGRLRTIEPGMETSPLARLLDRILDARTILMRARDAAKVGLVLLCAALSMPAEAASLKLAWNPSPPESKVTSYELVAAEVWGFQIVTVETPETMVEVAGLRPGVDYFFSVRARNSVGWSEFSDTIMGAPPVMLRLTIQRSTDLAAWQDAGEPLRVEKQAADFFRIKMEVEP